MGDETIEAIKKVQEIFEKQIHNNQIEKRSYEQLSQDFYSKNIPNKYKLPPPTNLPIFPQSKLHKIDLPRVHKTNSLNIILATESMNIQPKYPVVNHIYNTQGKRETIDTLRLSHQKDIWEKALSNEWGCLAQGNCHGVIPTNTISFIHKNEVPMDRDVTYTSFVCDHRPLKIEPWRVRIVVGGDRLSYSHDAGSPAASLLETKILLNSTISDSHKGARFMS